MREWLRAQAAGGYLSYDPAATTFTLPEAVAVAMLHAPGGAMIDACTSMLCSMGAGFADFTEAFRGSGGVRLGPAHGGVSGTGRTCSPVRPCRPS